MKCRDVQQLLHPYGDGELDLIRHVEIDEHLAECPACTGEVERLRAVRGAIASPALYYQAPAGLRQRIAESLAVATAPGESVAAQGPAPAVRRGRPVWSRLAVAAGFFLMIGVPGVVGMFLLQGRSSLEDNISERVVASHVRSLLVDHLVDVESTDRHTVKPWFEGKLDFAPQVPDLSDAGFALSGGRLDYLSDRPIAALVYYRRLHAINVLIWPGGDDDLPTRSLGRQGFHIRHWQQGGLTVWAISDLNDEELEEFVRLFRQEAGNAERGKQKQVSK